MPELIHAPVRRAQIFSGNANPELAEAVAQELDTELTPRTLDSFSDGEISCRLDDTVRGNYVFIIQSHGGGGMDVNRAIMEHLLLCQAARGAGAARVIAICPYMAYSRQDRKSQGREPISAKLITSALELAGADNIVTVDLHANQIQGFPNIPVDNLTAALNLREAVLPELEEGVVWVSPDAGRIKSATRHKNELPHELKASVAYIDKSRPPGKADRVEVLRVIGNVAGRQCVLVDDIFNTGSTLFRAAEQLRSEGATDILAITTHPVLSGNAVQGLSDSPIREVVVTDTRALTAEQATSPKIRVVTVAKLLAETIHSIFEDKSVSRIFSGENYS